MRDWSLLRAFSYDQIVFFSLIAQFINITRQRIVATQFAVYMAFVNLSRSGGAGAYSLVADQWAFTNSLYVVGGCCWVPPACCSLSNRRATRSRWLFLSAGWNPPACTFR
jgi:uncharacterized membrane protein|tara:strand:+ start:973 stop:1302 length:330 start_codon:yes stop_codon:yes gene_type:complete